MPTSMTLENVTIVLPTRNEEQGIARFLASLPPQVALLVVDASTDRTREVIWRERPERTQILHLPGTVTEARQIGAEAATTEWLLFTDADVEFAEDYFSRLDDALAEADVLYGAKCSRDAWARYYQAFALGQRLSHAMGIPAATGSNLLIRRRVLADVGGFDLRLRCNEDSEVVWRIKRGGYRVRFDAQFKVYEFDHRRLARGAALKTLHSLLRNLLLYTDLMPERWRTSDWGYWSQHPDQE